MGQVGDVAHEEAADAPAGENRLQEEDNRLFVGVPALLQHLAQEVVVQGDEFRAWALGVLADFAAFGREPVIEECEGAVSVDELFGMTVIGGDFADADILLEFLADFREVMELGQNCLAGMASVVEVAGDDPVDIAGLALLGSVAEAGVPHLAGIDAPGMDDRGAGLNRLLVKRVEGLVSLVGLEGFAIDDRDGCGVGGGVVLEFGDEVVEVLEVIVGAGLLVGVDDDGVDATFA